MVQVVDPHHPGLAGPVALVQRRDDVGARVSLASGDDRVLEVEEHLVGGQTLRLAEHLGVAARHREAGTARAQAAGLAASGVHLRLAVRR